MQVDWLYIDKDRGPTGETDVQIAASENTRVGAIRYATVRFTNEEGLYADLNLTQTSNTQGIEFSLTPNYIYVQGGGGTFYANVTSNSFWRVSSYDSFLTIRTSSFDGFGDGTITITFPPNDNSNNWSGYDHNGRPFYGRSGLIQITNIAGNIYNIYWEQAAYNAITVTPNSLIFPETGGSLTVTVTSSAEWEITSYDTDNVSFSALSGESGETVITVTKSALTEDQQAYHITKPSTAEFYDGANVALLFLETNISGSYTINDDYVTVTYYVPEAKVNTDMFLYRVASKYKNAYIQNGQINYSYEPAGYAFPSEVIFQDENNTGREQKSDPVTYIDLVTAAYFTKFTTPGYHLVKYKFPDNTLITKHMFAYSKDVVKVVVGNHCNGAIMACSVIDATNCAEVVLGLGTITSIGEAAFSGCGSYSKDLVLSNGIKELYAGPFQDFKARKVIYDLTNLGSGSTGNTPVTYSTSGIRKLIISGSTNSYDSDHKITSSSYTGTRLNWPGSLDCIEFVIGQNVEKIGKAVFYPFAAYTAGRVSGNVCNYDYIHPFPSFTNAIAKPITYERLSILKETPPETLTTNFTQCRQVFNIGQVVYDGQGNVIWPKTYRLGPSPTLPFHYPQGSDYSSWLTTFTNSYGDINI